MTWAPDYVTGDEFAAYVRVDDTIDDDQIAVWITAASRAVDKFANRQFGKVAVAESRTFSDMWCDVRAGVTYYVLSIDDLMSTVGMTIAGTAYADTGAVLLPRDAPTRGRPYTSLRFSTDPRVSGSYPEIAVSALWGWTAVPAQVVNATLMQANRYASRRESPYGIAGSPDAGSELRLLARLDPDVAVSLAGLQRRRVAR